MKKDGYHPDPKAASTLHSSDAELENIVAKADLEQEAEIDLPKGKTRTKKTSKAQKSAKVKIEGKSQRERSSKKPIILCILGIALLITLIVGYMIRTKPTTAVLHAASNFFSSKQVSMVGNIHIKLPYDEEFYNERYQKSFPAPAKDITISFDSKHVAATRSTTGYVKIITADDDEFDIKFHDAIAADGAIYLNVEGLKEAYHGTELPLILSTTTQHFGGTVDMIDGTWWKFSVPAVIATSNKYTDDEKAAYQDAYECSLSSINLAMNNHTEEFSRLYKDNQFLTPEEYHGKATKAQQGGTLYQVKLDQTKFNEFISGFFRTSLGKNLNNCTRPANVSLASVVNSLLRYIELDADATAVLEIDLGSEQISRAYYESSAEDGTHITADIIFDYSDSIKLDEIPADTTDAEPLVNQYRADAANVTYTYFYINYGAK